MVAVTSTPQPAVAPPQLPQDPSIPMVLSSYLQQFSLWCRNGFADKLKNNVALPGIMLQAYDAPTGTRPKVFLIRVSTAGVVSATPVAIGGPP